MKGYKTSKDYRRLKELLDSGMEVICLGIIEDPHMTFARVASYHAAREDEEDGHIPEHYALPRRDVFVEEGEDFETICEYSNIEFIEPTEGGER